MTMDAALPKDAARVALMGLLSVAAAMGIGRFAFTPMLPLMLNDGLLTLVESCLLAESNYLGYFLGAVLCSVLPGLWERRTGTEIPDAALAAIGLAATVALTLGMALPLPRWWPWLRFLSGMASALAFVFTANWCMRRLAQHHNPALAGFVYCGSGTGIALGGLSAGTVAALGWGAAAGWTLLGGLSGAIVLWAGHAWRRDRLRGGIMHAAAPAHAAQPAFADAAPPSKRTLTWLALAYGLAGFGYIIIATFLPVLAREMLPGSRWVDLFWPLFGLCAALGCLLATRLPQHWDNRLLLAACYGAQALGVVMGLWWPSVAGFVLCSVLVGTPLTALTLFAFREIRLRWPHRAASIMGLMTALYALGQILGPPLVGVSLRAGYGRAEVFAWSLHAAGAALLVGGAVWLTACVRAPARGMVRAY
ncbi:YbfB/YjiJ family MFS transporter [Xylophilus sp.]|uniref:YbfB/YjiJ family MFS transporter n=1 Tax=Xylophilus sp. TaxID=2653893 RepID=UPI002D7ED246|nr:YbfB/YjiJ family MFS transporter [Xylophilus sp.]